MSQWVAPRPIFKVYVLEKRFGVGGKISRPCQLQDAPGGLLIYMLSEASRNDWISQILHDPHGATENGARGGG